MTAVVYFNNNPVSPTTVHKHLGMVLNDKLSCEHHLNFVSNKLKKETFFVNFSIVSLDRL